MPDCMSLILTWICVNYFNLSYIATWSVSNLSKPWLEVNIGVTHFINDKNQIVTGFFSFALNQLQDFAHLKEEKKKKK